MAKVIDFIDYFWKACHFLQRFVIGNTINSLRPGNTYSEAMNWVFLAFNHRQNFIMNNV